jgi:hypothetical protein
MNQMKLVTLAIKSMKIEASIQDFGSEGVKVTVTKLADVFTAQKVADEVMNLWGIEVLVAF